MPDRQAPGRGPGRYVAAGVTYLLLSGVLFVLWIKMDLLVLVLLGVPTSVAGLVLLAVGWPRLRRRRRERRVRTRSGVAGTATGVRRS